MTRLSGAIGRTAGNWPRAPCKRRRAISVETANQDPGVLHTNRREADPALLRATLACCVTNSVGYRHGGNSGTQVRTKGTAESRKDNSRAQARHATKWNLGNKGDQPQASHCDRLVGSAARGREGAKAERIDARFESQVRARACRAAGQPLSLLQDPCRRRGSYSGIRHEPIGVPSADEHSHHHATPRWEEFSIAI